MAREVTDWIAALKPFVGKHVTVNDRGVGTSQSGVVTAVRAISGDKKHVMVVVAPVDNEGAEKWFPVRPTNIMGPLVRGLADGVGQRNLLFSDRALVPNA